MPVHVNLPHFYWQCRIPLYGGIILLNEFSVEGLLVCSCKEQSGKHACKHILTAHFCNYSYWVDS